MNWIFQKTREQKLFNYMKAWVDSLVDEAGKIHGLGGGYRWIHLTLEHVHGRTGEIMIGRSIIVVWQISHIIRRRMISDMLGRKEISCALPNSSCNRNYSIMVLDGCPSNIVPGERYFDHRVLHHNVQRFYDIFDGYIADSKNNEKPLIITIALEAFRGFMDWSAVNDLAVRYMVQKAATEKIIFTSAADVADYHKADKKDVKLKKVVDHWTGNSHLFVDLGYIKEGHTEVKIVIEGTERVPASAGCKNRGVGFNKV